MSVIDKEVMELYNKHFLRVSQPVPLNEVDKEPLPKALSSCFGERVREKMQEKLVWVKIVFPAHFTPEILEELHAGINIVPVENKLLHEQTTSLEDTFRVIPLRTGNYESLLSVHSVKDSDGKSYHELQYPVPAPRRVTAPIPSAREAASVLTPAPPRNCSAICWTCWMTRPTPSMPFRVSSCKRSPARWSN